jgi:hypothetical protein
MKSINKNIIAIFFFFFLFQSIFAQRNLWKEHNFKDSTSLSYVDEKYADEDAVIIKRVNLIEYKGLGAYTILKTFYQLIRVNNDIGLEAYNRIYIPMYGVYKIVDIQVRFISPDGKVTTLNRNAIQKIENLEGYGDFTVFAIEGAEVGGEIEYKYTLSMRASYSHLTVFRNKYPIQEATFDLVAPSGLNIYIEGYNGFPEFEVDSKGRQAWYAKLYNVEPFETEPNALNTSNRIKVAYGIIPMGNYTSQAWTDMVERKHAYLHKYENHHKKIAMNINAGLNLNNKSQQQKIENIRKYAMDSIKYVDVDGYYQLPFKRVLKKKEAISIRSKYKVMAILFDVNNISFETLWATDKYFAEYIINYPYSFNQDRFLFYFPEVDLYLDPTNYMYPLGLIPYEHLDTDSYKVRKEVRTLTHINAADTSKSKEMVDIKFYIDSNWHVNITSRFEMYGYKAAEWRSFLQYIDDEDKEEMFEKFHSTHMLDLNMTDVKIINDSIHPDHFPQLPLVIEFEMNSKMIIESGGSDYLLNIGRLLRNSIDFYHENERRQDIIMTYPEAIYTNIEFNIPQGYTIEGLDDLKQNMNYTNESGEISYFLSTDYSLENNRFIFSIKEGNTACRYPAEDYDQIRPVINAISDLSFLKLAFTPKVADNL